MSRSAKFKCLHCKEFFVAAGAPAVIGYELFCRIRALHRERGLNFKQIGEELGIDPKTAAKYARAGSYRLRRGGARSRPSKLDPFKGLVVTWLERHPYSATQAFQRLRLEHGYEGGFSILKEYVRRVRPVRRPAFLTLAFAPGESAQVDWGARGIWWWGRRAGGSRSLSWCSPIHPPVRDLGVYSRFVENHQPTPHHEPSDSQTACPHPAPLGAT